MRYLQRGLTHRDTDRDTPGFTLYTPLRNSTTYIVNMAGDIVHQWDLPAGPTNYGYLLPNGNLLIALRSDDSPHEMARGGIMRELDWDGNVVCRIYRSVSASRLPPLRQWQPHVSRLAIAARRACRTRTGRHARQRA